MMRSEEATLYVNAVKHSWCANSNKKRSKLEICIGLINRCALAPVSAAGTGANALRLITKLKAGLLFYSSAFILLPISWCVRVHVPLALPVQHYVLWVSKNNEFK